MVLSICVTVILKKVKKMISDENDDRKLLFKSMSLKTGGTVDDVAKKFSMAIVKK